MRHGIDATSLGSVDPPLGGFDHIIFNHPHLRLADLANVGRCRRREVLISHYMASALSRCRARVMCGTHTVQGTSRAPGQSIGSRALAVACGQWMSRCPAAAVILEDEAASKPPSRHAPSTPPQESWAARSAAMVSLVAALVEPHGRPALQRQPTQSRPYPNASSRYEHRRSEGDMDMHVDKQ